MNVLSLFDGMSCGQLALHRSGIKYNQYFSSEIDKYCVGVTNKNFPNTIQLGDIQKINCSKLPKIDLLIGGSPCQGFSKAGKGLNFSDPRSQLFFRFVDILREIKPAHFLLENVLMKQEWQDIISNHLEVKPVLINSSLVSAQNRRRLYWTNFPVSQPLDKGIFFKDIFRTTLQSKYYYSEKALKWIEHVSNKYGKKLCLYDPFSNQKMQMLEASMYKKYSKQRFFGIKDVLGIRFILPEECELAQTVPIGYTSSCSDTQRYKMLGNGWTVDIISHILNHIK